MNGELFFDGKKYISAKRASEITGYTSDYIGQLCRGNKLECRQVGRGWFVSEFSIINHKKISAEKPRGTIIFPPKVGNYFEKLPETVPKPSSANDLSFSTLFSASLKQALFYFSAVSLVILIGVFITISHNKDAQIRVATITENLIDSQKDLVVALVSHPVGMSPGEKISLNTKRFIYWIGGGVNRLALNTYVTISDWLSVGTKKHLVFTQRQEQPSSVLDSGGRFGIVTSPSSGDANQDELTKQKIKNSFSDETNVIPDKSGTSGVIKPVFRSQTDQEYLYVLVPVPE